MFALTPKHCFHYYRIITWKWEGININSKVGYTSCVKWNGKCLQKGPKVRNTSYPQPESDVREDQSHFSWQVIPAGGPRERTTSRIVTRLAGPNYELTMPNNAFGKSKCESQTLKNKFINSLSGPTINLANRPIPSSKDGSKGFIVGKTSKGPSSIEPSYSECLSYQGEFGDLIANWLPSDAKCRETQ